MALELCEWAMATRVKNPLAQNHFNPFPHVEHSPIHPLMRPKHRFEGLVKLRGAGGFGVSW